MDFKCFYWVVIHKLDNLIKEYFDKFRGDLPPELKNKVEGKLIDDRHLLKQWRNTHQPGLICYLESTIGLAGALDDCLIIGKKNPRYAPIEFKMKGKDITKSIPPYYQNQLDCYTLLLEKCDYPTKKFGYLVYYILEKIKENGLVKFKVVECLRGPRPAANPNCPYCQYRKK
ncbi:MAG: hypothetical protein ACP5IX_02725 [Patescibacteria group bacterium]